MNYKEYLKSPQWAEARKLVMQRAGDECEAKIGGCGVTATEVHHDDYRYLFNEPLWALRAVCRPCHEKITEMDKRNGRRLP